MASKSGNEVLKALDTAKTQSYHFKAIIIAGMGFFTDAYDIFVISVVVHLLGRIYYYDPAKPTTVGVLPANVYSAVTATALCGTVVGQLLFGWAGDKWGRKKVYGITLAVMVVTSLGQGLSLGHTKESVITTLCFFRFLLGVGIGGDYPLSATIMSEYANSKTRGAFVAAVFSMQGIGILTGGAICIIVSAIFKAAYPRQSFAEIGQASTAPQSDFVWRIILMFGAVPAAMTYYSRSHMPETARYTALVERDQELAARNMGKVLDEDFGVKDSEVVPPGRKLKRAMAKPKLFGLFSPQFARRHGLELVGTCMSWFLLDISFYSQNLFQSNIFQAVGWLPKASKMSALEEVYKNGRAQALIALVSTVPGYWFTVAFIDIVGRKPIQLMGFAMMSIFMYVLSLDFYSLRGTPNNTTGKDEGGNHLAFIILYAFTFFFSNFGPNATTFIVPSELFPARLRSTCHGISSACGKVGSIVGTFGFLYASQSRYTPQAGYPKGIGIRYALLLLAICSTAGLFFTFLIPETKGRSLEELSGEDDENNADGDGAKDPDADGVKALDNGNKV